ncbi:hypothetical protein D9611_002053 [Ephemerocybe angulata]|uniref:C2H2-type domain-containing protein n=1 Tax=Ephemerocybe angulata TaxID=980116 RepID=A0A8H5CIP4_9AGAR|nr:hypothetical protein D9611_002053 [Tulosesus angulatus]
MAAQMQCDQPHVHFESWRNSPANASKPCPGRVSSVPGLSDIDMDIAPPHSISELEYLGPPVALKDSTLETTHFPSPSFLLSPLTRPASPASSSSSLDSIGMPSTIVSFGSHSGIAPDFQVVRSHEDLMRINSLERQVCSNYVCCGVHLADFHALINHFESKHISLVAPNGKRIYPPERLKVSTSQNSSASTENRSSLLSFRSPLPSTPSSSRSSSVESSTPPPTTPTGLSLDPFSSNIGQPILEYSPYLGLALSFGPEKDAAPHPFANDMVISAFGPEYDFSKDYARYERCFTDRVAQLRRQQQKEQDQLLEDLERAPEEEPVAALAHSGVSRTPSPSPSADSSGVANAIPAPSQAPVEPSSEREARVLEICGVDAPKTNNGGKVAKPRAKSAAAGSNPVSTTGRKRDKNFKCPHQGCTKSYLNPNGLKYHLEKGTCKFDDRGNDASESSSSESAMGSAAESSSPSSGTATPVETEPKPLAPSPPSVSTKVASPASTSFAYQYPNIAPAHVAGMFGPFDASMTPQQVYQSIMRHAATIPSFKVSPSATFSAEPVIHAPIPTRPISVPLCCDSEDTGVQIVPPTSSHPAAEIPTALSTMQTQNISYGVRFMAAASL